MNEPEICILKAGTCQSLTGRSELKYHIGCKGDAIYIQLFRNSQKGLLSQKWVPIEQIILLLTKDEAIKSKTLKPIYAGQSANCPGFLMAVLKHEKLVMNSDSQSRKYISCDPSEFINRIQKLIIAEKNPAALKTTKKSANEKKGKENSEELNDQG